MIINLQYLSPSGDNLGMQMKFSFLKTGTLLACLFFTNLASAALITIKWSGFNPYNVNDTYKAQITLDDAIATNDKFDLNVFGVVDFKFETFGRQQLLFNLKDVPYMRWYNALDIAHPFARPDFFVFNTPYDVRLHFAASNAYGFTSSSNFGWAEIYEHSSGHWIHYVSREATFREVRSPITIPEPSSITIFALALCGLMARRLSKLSKVK